MTTWKRIDDGLYQRFDDGVPQNLYIDRLGYTQPSGRLKVEAWTACERVGVDIEIVGGCFWDRLRDAKKEMSEWEVKNYD